MSAEEDICPNCEEPFDRKTTFDADVDFSVSSTHATFERVCVFHVHEETWVYLHVDTVAIEETIEFDEERAHPPDLTDMVEEMRGEADAQ